MIMLVHPRWSYIIERLSEPCAGVYNGPPAVYRVWHQTAGIQKRNFPRSSLAHVYAHVVRASGHMPDRTTADRDHTLGILPHFRDRPT